MATRSPHSILVVDDDWGNRQPLCCVFRNEGFVVFEADSGQQALEVANRTPLDLVILDVNLPDISGFEVCHRLRSDPGTRSLSILHLSAVFVAPSDRSAGLEGGADAYLTKPVEPRELLANVKALLRVHDAEEAARRAAQEWRITFDAISDAVCLIDADGRIRRLNQALAELLGQPFNALIGQPLDKVLKPAMGQDSPLLPLALNDDRDGREIHLNSRWFRVSSDPIHDQPGSTASAGNVVILTDVTQRKELEEQLRQSQRLEAVGRLAGGIAHDFNNLLTAILGNASLLMHNLPAGQPEQTLAATIERAAWRAAELTRQLLGFSRQTLLWLQAVDPASLLVEVANGLTSRLPALVHLKMDCPADLWSIQADPTQMNLILTNLCYNALEAMPRGGCLVLQASNERIGAEQAKQHLEARPGEFVRLSVADEGEGIAPEILDKIFDPFFTTKPMGRGSGLGLAMVYGIVKQHQGWVQVHSSTDSGTRFDLYLPRMLPAATPDAPTPSRVAMPSGQRVVLLADDNDTLRTLAAGYLQQGGFEVLLACDGREAVEVFRRESGRISCVILDQMMPLLTGQEALTEMREICPSMPAVLASSTTDQNVGVEGGASVLGKPYRERELLQAVNQALAMKTEP